MRTVVAWAGCGGPVGLGRSGWLVLARSQWARAGSSSTTACETRDPAEKGNLRALRSEHPPLERPNGPVQGVGHPPSGQYRRSGRLVSPPAQGDQGFRPHF